MNIKTLDQILHSEDQILLLQGSLQREYRNSKEYPQIAGEYKKQEYIRLYYREGMEQKMTDFALVINWPNEESPYHVHDWIELSYIYSGTCNMKILDKELNLKEGQFILLDTDAPHAVGITGGNNILINMAFSQEYLYNHFFNHLTKDNLVTQFVINALNEQTSHDRYIVFSPRKKEKVKGMMQELMCEYFDASFCAHDILSSYITLVLCELVRDYPNSLANGKNNYNILIASVLRYIDNHYLDCTLESTADFFNMNPNYLTTQLKKYLNKSFKTLVLERKFEFARRKLVYTSDSIRKIASDIGYENRSYFNHKFKEFYGMLQGEYRKEKTEV